MGRSNATLGVYEKTRIQKRTSGQDGPTRAILSQRAFGAISSVRPRGPHKKIGPHFANGCASQAISRAGRLEKSVLLAVTGDEKAIS